MYEGLRSQLRRTASLDAKHSAAGLAETTGQGLSNLPIILTVLEDSTLNVDLFSLFQAAIQALPGQITSPALAQYRFDVDYFASNPAMLRAIRILSSETGNAPLLTSINLTSRLRTPFQFVADNGVGLLSYKSSQQFQNGILDIPYNQPLTGYNYLSLSSDYTATEDVTLTLTLWIDQRIEQGDKLVMPGELIQPGFGGAMTPAGQPYMGAPPGPSPQRALNR